MTQSPENDTNKPSDKAEVTQDINATEDEARASALVEDVAVQDDDLQEMLELLESERAELKKKRTHLDTLQDTLEKKRLKLKKQEQAADQEQQKAHQIRKEAEVRAQTLTTQKKELKRQEDALKQKEHDLELANSDLESKRATLANREREALQREAAAVAGFAEQNETALASLRQRQEQLTKELTALTTTLAETRRDRFAALEKEIEQDRQARLAALKQTIANSRVSERTTLDQELAQAREDLKAQLKATAEKENKLREQMNDLAIQKKTLEDGRDMQERMFNHRKTILAEERSRYQQVVEQEVSRRLLASQQEQNNLTSRYQRLQEDRTRLEKELQSFAELKRWLHGRTPETIETEIQDLQQQLQKLQQELLERPTQQDMERFRLLQNEKRGWQQERAELIDRIRSHLSKLRDQDATVAEWEHYRDLAHNEKRRREALQAQIDKLGAEVNRLRALYEQPEEEAARREAIDKPYLNVKRGFQRDIPSEIEWLQQIGSGIEASGLTFPNRLLRAFHTALKTSEWSPLTVLAGVSGTGKSELPKLYARFGGLHYLPLAVEPNWDSPQSLFGFFNSVDNRFNATPLLRSMVQSQQSPNDRGCNDALLLILLDEMNLAHIELYFSELLSKLELRRGRDKPVNVEIDLGAGLEKYRVPLGRNILWTGTMNEDETTKTLSDKVLDRSSLISFPRPRSLKRRKKLSLAPKQALLPRKTWESWQDCSYSFTDDAIQPYKSALEEMNSYLETAGRALGHRVWQAIEGYICNHPDVISAPSIEEQERSVQRAFEDALVFKVMPKLRGIETRGHTRRRCLDPILELLGRDELGLNLQADFRHACEVGGLGIFVWSSARYLDETNS